LVAVYSLNGFSLLEEIKLVKLVDGTLTAGLAAVITFFRKYAFVKFDGTKS